MYLIAVTHNSVNKAIKGQFEGLEQKEILFVARDAKAVIRSHAICLGQSYSFLFRLLD